MPSVKQYNYYWKQRAVKHCTTIINPLAVAFLVERGGGGERRGGGHRQTGRQAGKINTERERGSREIQRQRCEREGGEGEGEKECWVDLIRVNERELNSIL